MSRVRGRNSRRNTGSEAVDRVGWMGRMREGQKLEVIHGTLESKNWRRLVDEAKREDMIMKGGQLVS